MVEEDSHNRQIKLTFTIMKVLHVGWQPRLKRETILL